METKQQSQATTIENLKSETGWEFTVLLIKKTECISSIISKTGFWQNRRQDWRWVKHKGYMVEIGVDITHLKLQML